MEETTCTFCNIVAGKELATVRYEDDEILAFDNLLTWVPIMILVVPKKHMGQVELWTNPVASKVTRAAVDLGALYCPGGFRILSNLGRDAMQSQPHGHLHVIGGTHLGLYA